MTSSKNEHWNTPDVVLDCVRQLGPIKLDPCSNKNSIVGAQIEWYGPHEGHVDGLAEDWNCGGVVFVNPPYGRKITPWIKKCVTTAAIAKQTQVPTEIVLLGPSRTDVIWFQDFVLQTADCVLLWKGRLTFGGAKDPAVFPSFLAYWGHRPGQFRQAFAGKGWCT